MLIAEQVTKIKSQLIAQIEKSFPHDKKEFAINQIDAMDSEQLEAFLRQNQLIKGQNSPASSSAQHSTNQCVFCSIVQGNIQSHRVDENSDALAVLEINPVSNGHVLIIPKTHLASSDQLKKSIFSLAKSISKRIKVKLKPKDVTITSSNLMGHEVVNLIPIYDGVDSTEERKHLEHQELIDLQKSLEKKTSSGVKRVRKVKPSAVVKEDHRWLPRRIP